MILTSVPDPWHFGTDPDSQIRIFDQKIRIRIRILLFSSVTFKMPTKNNLFLQVFMLIPFWRYIYIILQRQKVKKTVKVKVFLHFFAGWWKDPDPEVDPYKKKITDPDEHWSLLFMQRQHADYQHSALPVAQQSRQRIHDQHWHLPTQGTVRCCQIPASLHCPS